MKGTDGLSHRHPKIAGGSATHELIAAIAGKPATNRSSRKMVPLRALRESTVSDETQMPAVIEKNKPLASASAARQNSPPVSPPSNSEIASTGKSANRP